MENALNQPAQNPSIEACLLFNLQPDQIQVVIHPQSIIHSMVDYVDGSVLAQMGNPDMRIPIAHAMAWPDISHLGCATACSTVTSARSFKGVVRNGPPDAVNRIRLAVGASCPGV
jgi:1-deoxy-D-xylulose 5-phosphate reductoisomerase